MEEEDEEEDAGALGRSGFDAKISSMRFTT